MPRLVHIAVVAMVAMITIFVSNAYADTNAEEAQRLAEKGQKLGNAGDYQGALVMFKRAIALDNRTDLQCNLGHAYNKLARWPEAHLHLGTCLGQSVDLNNAKWVKLNSRAYASVESKLKAGEFAQVTFTVTPKHARVRVSALPGDVSFTTPRSVWLPTGEHTVSATALGHHDGNASVTVLKAKPTTFTLALTQDLPKKVTRSKVGGFIGLSIAAAALIPGAVFYYFARDASNDAKHLGETDPLRDELKTKFEFRRLMSYSLFGASAIAAAVGTYLLIRSRKTPEQPVVGAAVSGNSAVVWTRFQF